MSNQKQVNMTFLLGAGRSGSTLLYKLLSLHPKVGYISSYNNSLPDFLPTGRLNGLLANQLHLKRKVWFEKGGNAHGFQRSILNRLVPWPVEGENVYARAGIPLFENEEDVVDMQAAARFRKRLLALAKQQNADSMLSKRVANNRRVPWLKESFPEAKYIHLVRDGRDVAYSFSKVGWWNADTQVWWAGKTMKTLVEQDGWDTLSVTAKTWVEAVKAVEENLQQVPAQQILRVRYEDILANPLRTLDDILTFMHVDAMSAYMQTVKELKLRPVDAKWKSDWNEQDYTKVLTQQQNTLLDLGYK